jgi:large subunit ribosomal protein L1
VIAVPHAIKKKKICAFLDKRSGLVDSITLPEFEKFKDKKSLKKLVKEYDFFIASAPLMPKVATVFGKILGPTGKMPSPQLGIMMTESEENIKSLLEKINKSVKVRMKEASIKVAVGKENMKEEDIAANILALYEGIANALPKKKENVRNIMVKTTMGKPIKVELK